MPKDFTNENGVFEAKTLEEAYEKASVALECSIVELEIDIVQSPSKGFLGFFSKTAIITAKSKNKRHYSKKDQRKEKNIKVETLSTKLESLEKKETKKVSANKSEQIKKEKIFDGFYNSKEEEIHKVVVKKGRDKIIAEIKKDVNDLFAKLCYEIDEIKVDIIDAENTVYIEFNGEDSALLIGKEGYRYKALSYILFNWINEKYDMMLRLEIAEFLSNQEKSIYTYLEPVIEIIKKDGYFKTKTLDGILVHIALSKLREEFPDKYVAVKTNQKGEKYILVNEYRN
jgi:spoIIIJ-associated protein